MTPQDPAKQRLTELLNENRQALEASAKGYDTGNLWEAKRIATALYTLAYDGGRNTKSLLGQIGVLQTMGFFNTTRGLSDAKPDTPLCLISLGMETQFVPFCAAGFNPPESCWQGFEDWWKDPVYRSPDGALLSRQDLVGTMRCQDGGAHVDGEVRVAAYTDMKDVVDKSLTTTDPAGNQVPIPHAHLATMRQIGHEMLASLEKLMKRE